MLQFFANLPRFVRAALVGGGTLVTGFSSKLPDALQEAGLLAGITLASLGIIAFIWHWLNERRIKAGKGKIALDPSTFLPAFTVLALIGVVGIAVTLVWQTLRPARPTETVVVVPSAPAPITTPTGPVTLIPNRPTQEFASEAERVARYVQLKRAILQLQHIKDKLPGEIEAYRWSVTAPAKRATSVRSYSATAMSGWPQTLQRIKEINGSLYTNRSIDLETAPELAIPTMRAPDEEQWGDDGAGQWRYRAFHFLSINVVKQLDALLADVQREFSSLESAFAKRPGLEFIGSQK